jgi:hypothetical protein
MPDASELAAFIRDNFRSVWTLELLLFLKDHAALAWQNDALVQALRASDAIVSTSVENLFAAGLVLTDRKGAQYAPASDDLRELVDEAQRLYARQPDAVRRLCHHPHLDCLLSLIHSGLGGISGAGVSRCRLYAVLPHERRVQLSFDPQLSSHGSQVAIVERPLLRFARSQQPDCDRRSSDSARNGPADASADFLVGRNHRPSVRLRLGLGELDADFVSRWSHRDGILAGGTVLSPLLEKDARRSVPGIYLGLLASGHEPGTAFVLGCARRGAKPALPASLGGLRPDFDSCLAEKFASQRVIAGRLNVCGLRKLSNHCGHLRYGTQVRTRLSICIKKASYRSEEEAREAAGYSGLDLRTYRCDRCGRIHLTSRTKGKRIPRPGK